MVSGGSDSAALLELAALDNGGKKPHGKTGSKLLGMLQAALPRGRARDYHCLHINHQLRGDASDGDEAFVEERCKELGIPFHSKRVDVIGLMSTNKQGMEACARELRYEKAAQLLGVIQENRNTDEGLVLTAHTIDDRVETFLMRALVGTGPGGLASIPRSRGAILRPLLDVTREELRDFLRKEHPETPDEHLWRDDATNEDGSNFRSRIRTRLVPVMRDLNPGFEHNLARTMDLVASENDTLQAQADGIVYRNLIWSTEGNSLPLSALKGLDTPMMRRVLRQSLLAVQPEARLESTHIECLVEAVQQVVEQTRMQKGAERSRYSCDVAGGVRVVIANGEISMSVVEYPN